MIAGRKPVRRLTRFDDVRQPEEHVAPALVVLELGDLLDVALGVDHGPPEAMLGEDGPELAAGLGVDLGEVPCVFEVGLARKPFTRVKGFDGY